MYDHFVAGRYDKELAEITDQFRRICFEGTGLQPGQTVLDLGCGEGKLIRMMLKEKQFNKT